MVAERIFAWLGSFLGNATLFGAIAAGWPGLPGCCWPSRDPSLGPLVLELSWFRPSIVDLGDHPDPRARDRPLCPHPRAASIAFDLIDAPMPAGFAAEAWRDSKLYACVRVGGQGDVTGVRLVGVPRGALAASLEDRIRHDWRFSTDFDDRGGWLQVRLNGEPHLSRFVEDGPIDSPPSYHLACACPG